MDPGFPSKKNIYIFMHVIQHCVICRLSDSTVSEDAVIEPWAVATLSLTARRKEEKLPSTVQ
jgi:hypothetical protein